MIDHPRPNTQAMRKEFFSTYTYYNILASYLQGT